MGIAGQLAVDDAHHVITAAVASTAGSKDSMIIAVEPVLGTLINHHNMKRINSRGIAQASKHVLMSALTYNVKKYLKYTTRKSNAIVLAMDCRRQYGSTKRLIMLTNGILTVSATEIESTTSGSNSRNHSHKPGNQLSEF